MGRVLLTGATGFVGRWVLRELVRRGFVPVCLVRDRRRMEDVLRQLGVGGEGNCGGAGTRRDSRSSVDDTQEGIPAGVGARIPTYDGTRTSVEDSRTSVVAQVVEGDLFDEAALAQAAAGVEAAIHLVGIIAEDRRRGQTFERVHVLATKRAVDACRAAGVRRFIHMSALGARPRAASEYHRTKWAAECYVRESGLDWTIFRPSVIHGSDGEFMRLMRKLTCGYFPPVMPHIGNGLARLQPVSVRDVAHCFAAALALPETIGQAYDLGGPDAMTWRELYRICREVMPGAQTWKPVVGQPVALAKLLAGTVMRLPLVPRSMRFNADQVQMSQEDSVCDAGPVERAFGIKLRGFREELAEYTRGIE